MKDGKRGSDIMDLIRFFFCACILMIIYTTNNFVLEHITEKNMHCLLPNGYLLLGEKWGKMYLAH